MPAGCEHGRQGGPCHLVVLVLVVQMVLGRSASKDPLTFTGCLPCFPNMSAQHVASMLLLQTSVVKMLQCSLKAQA